MQISALSCRQRKKRDGTRGVAWRMGGRKEKEVELRASFSERHSEGAFDGFWEEKKWPGRYLGDLCRLATLIPFFDLKFAPEPSSEASRKTGASFCLEKATSSPPSFSPSLSLASS